jgi:hypothetical protein
MPAGPAGLFEIDTGRVLGGRPAHFERAGARADMWIVKRRRPERGILGIPGLEIAIEGPHPLPGAHRDCVAIERSLSAEKGSPDDGNEETSTERSSRGMHENSVIRKPGVGRLPGGRPNSLTIGYRPMPFIQSS